MRDYKFRLVEAVDEALQAAAAAEVPVQISHFQAVGKKSWSLLDRALEKIEQSQRQGIDVAIDAYPYMAGCCSLSQFLPDWVSGRWCRRPHESPAVADDLPSHRRRNR